MRINEARELNDDELAKEFADQKRALMNLRFRKETMQLSDTNEIRNTRRSIARLSTVIRERQIAAKLSAKAQGE